MTFWESVSDLRQVEFIALLVMMIIPIVSGTLILTVRHRIKILQTEANLSQGTIYQGSVQTLGAEKHRLSHVLTHTQEELNTLRRMTAPRHLTDAQKTILLRQLDGVKAAPVIVSAYAFEEESASYAADIVEVLRKAGWDATMNKASMNDFKGLSLGTINLTQKPLIGLHELAQAFTAAHLELHQREIAPDSIAGPLEDGSLLVVVGRK